MKEKVVVIKVGGNVIDNPEALSSFLRLFADLPFKKVLIHGGGKVATQLAKDLHIPQQMIEGRRITDAETLKVVTMVYAGLINKNIVATLQSYQCNALGLTGADANLITAHKRVHESINYGYVGDVDVINSAFIKTIIDQDIALVVAPITHDGQGQLLNTNADTCAQVIAEALSEYYEVSLIYSFEKNGVLLDVNDDESVIPVIDTHSYEQLKADQIIFEGMLPKLNGAFNAIHNGVKNVIIGKWEDLNALIEGTKGTTIQR